MADVSAYGDGQTFQFSLLAADRQGIEKRLGRVFMFAVTSVDYRAIPLFGQQIDRPNPERL